MAKKESKLIKGLKQKTVHEPPRELCRVTVQDSIPFFTVHEKENIIETYPGFYTRMYDIAENNYQTETEEVQQQMFINMRNVFNSLGPNVEMAVTIFNKDINIEDFKESTLKKETGDELDFLRREINQITLDRIQEGRNGLQKCKYITLGVHAQSLKKAVDIFDRRLDLEMSNAFKKMQSNLTPVPIERRLEILHDIYNIGDQGEFLTKTRILDDRGIQRDVTSFDMDNIRSMGLTVKDVIAPSSIEYNPKYMRIGNKYVRVMRIVKYPASMMDDFFVKLTDVPFNLLTTVNVQPIPAAEANRIVHKNLVLARNEKADERRGLIKANLPEDMISPETEDRVAKAEELREEMVENDEKLFKTTFTVVFWADSLQELQGYTESIIASCPAVGLHTMDEMQETGFNATLPLLYNAIPYKMKRTFKSSSVTTISMPFSNLELNDPGGINYSNNRVSKNLIIYNRLLTQNFNGFILGTPGSGKSFTAKVEMLNVTLGSNSKCIVIDPEAEYPALAKLIHGEVIKIEPGGRWHINPMEINTDYEFSDDETNPVLAKADFILKLLEVMVKTPFGLNSIQETIIDECVHSLYAPFCDECGNLGKIPREKMPTLTDLQVALAGRREPEARELAMALKLYTGTGSLNTFGFQSNVDVDNRFIVYNIKDIGEKLKPIAMLIILDSIQNTLFQNRKRGRNTWFWVDEIYLLFQDELSATFLNQLFKRARKYGGVPTGITQNVEDLLESDTARKMLSNCNFVQILNQAPADREKLAALLNLSESMVDVITGAPRGQGLIWTGTNTVGFHSVWPSNTQTYRVLTSSMAEIKAFEEEDRRRALIEQRDVS